MNTSPRRRALRPILAALLLLGLGCGDKDEGEETASPDDTAADTEADTDTDTDTDTDADGDSDTDGDTDTDLCGGYTGIRGIGSQWTWQYTGSLVGGSTSRVENISGTTVVMDVHTQITSNGYTTTYNMTTTYRCDAQGLWHSRAEVDYHTVGPSYDYRGSTSSIYSDYLVTPSNPHVGTRWSNNVTGTTTDGATGNTTNFSFVSAGQVTAEETVTVPAGTYTALRTTLTTDSNVSTAWLAAGVGSVKADSSVLTDYSP